MNKYTFRVYTTYDPEDGFNVWTNANSEVEAERIIQEDYHSIIRLELLSIQ